MLQNFDFNALIAQHVKTDADITFAYTKEELPQEPTGAKDASKGLYYTLKLDGDKVEDIYINKQETGCAEFLYEYTYGEQRVADRYH